MANKPWFYDQAEYGDPGHIGGPIHAFGNAWFYEIRMFGQEIGEISVFRGTILDYDIYIDELYDVYIWLKQRLVRTASVDWES